MYYKNRFMFINCLIHNKKRKSKLYFPYCTLFCSSQKSEIANTSTNTQHEFIFSQIHRYNVVGSSFEFCRETPL